MIVTTKNPSQSPAHRADKAISLALRLAQAENALLALTSGEVDAIVDPSGKTHLLRPAQEELRQNEKRLQAVIKNAADVITTVNRGGAILSQSGAVDRVLGYEEDELVGTKIFDLVHDDDLPRVYAAYFEVIEGFHPNSTAHFRHRAPDGSYRLIEATVGKLRDFSPTSVVFSLRPVSTVPLGRTQAVPPEPAPADTSLPKDRFLAMLSHELRVPLTSVLLGIDELQEDKRFANARPTLAMIRRNIELQARLLEELSEFVVVGQHKVRLQLKSVDASEAVRFVLQICQSEFTAAQIGVVLDLQAAEDMVVADPVKLQQVMWNLVRNGIKFSPPGGSIFISSTNDAPGSLTLKFADQGIGIEPELLPLVFDPFQQGEGTRQRFGGLGLGLFIAKGLTEAQGGTLTVSSKGRGMGATFQLTLPTTLRRGVPSEVVPLKELSASLWPSDSISVLLVGDCSDSGIASLLGQFGYVVFTASEMLVGLALAENCRFDLVISETTLPGGSGYELMRRLRLTRPALAGIAVSASGSLSESHQSREAGFSEHLVKPVTVDSLQRAIHRCREKALAAQPKDREAPSAPSSTAYVVGSLSSIVPPGSP